MNTFYTKLQSQLLKTLRGTLSQENFARKLSLQSDQIIRWENSHAKISWEDFTLVCKRFDAGLAQALKTVLLYKSNDWTSTKILKHVWRDLSYPEIQEKTGFSKARISRLLNGKGKISLVDVFHIIESGSLPLDTFVSRILKGRDLPDVLLKNQKYNHSLLNMIYDRPWIGALLRTLEIAEYLQSPLSSVEYVAGFLNVPEQDVELAFSDLLSAKLIEPCDEGKFKPLNKNLLGQADRLGELKVRHYWTSKALRMLEHKMTANQGPGQPTVWAYQVLSISEEGKKEIEDCIVRCYREIDDIVKSAKHPVEKVLLFNMQLLPVDLLPK